MKLNLSTKLAVLASAFILLAGSANAQWGTPNAYGYNTGYGAVYGTFNQAALIQSMYNVTRSEQLKRGSSARSPVSSKADTSASKSKSVAARNLGTFTPDPSVDTGKLLSDSLGSDADEKALIKRIYDGTRSEYEKEASAKGWTNNIAGGLVFFTVAAMTVYHDAPEPSEAAVDEYFETVNASINQMPAFGSIQNRDKQSFQNTMIGFGGMLLAIYTEGKRTHHAGTLAASKQLAGMLIKMVLKTEPENIKLEDGRIVWK